ncbi:CPBP family intramembrane glutamic endopeptidase [Maribacter sp. 2210JD10-5]|uniref:CPBP family intramembrane glutamic endopeptidase n=1 Tax=Maribacter sp. 2210JD10-5 TaxID=3386272 RepID=UPI0039BCE91B
MRRQLWDFLKNPTYREDENKNIDHRLRIFSKLVLFSLVLSFLFATFLGILEIVFKLNLGEHAMDTFVKEYPVLSLFFGAVILAPVLEELVFRGPMLFFKEKSYFRIVFYVLTVLFGFLHISNFELSTIVILLSPILVLPQLAIGVILGFIRVRFGLLWSMALHACYNGILIIPLVLAKLLKLPLA